MPNIITEIEQSLNDVPPLKIDIAPVTIPSAPPVDVTKIAPPIAPPELTPVLPSPSQSQPLEAVPSTGSPVSQVPVIDALSYGDTISKMSAESAAETARVLADTTPKPNNVAGVLNPLQAPVQINPQLSSQNNPFAASKANSPQNASERMAFEPPILANGMANPFSDPNARAAIAAGISKEEYIAYIRDASAAGDDQGFGSIVDRKSNIPALQGVRDSFTTWNGWTAAQIRAEMSKKTGYLSGRRNFNMSFLPLSGGENRSELETLFAALSYPANLFKGIGLDVLRPAAAVVSGGLNVEEVKKAYDAMRPTNGGTFTGAAILGEQFSSLAQIDEKGKPFNPLAAVGDDRNIFQVGLGFGLDILADPLNSDALVGRLLRPLGRANKVADVIAELPKVDVPVRTPDVPRLPEPERFRVQRELATAIPENTKPLSRLNPPSEVVIEREIARSQELATVKPVERVFIEPKQPFTPIPDSRAIVPTVPEVNLYNNVTSAFNDLPSLPEVQQLMREVIEYRAIPDERALSVVVRNNPIIQDVLEFARTGDITPNIAVLQGATKSEIEAIVADRLELIKETPFVVPKLQIELPREVPRLEYNIVEQVQRQPARNNVNSFIPDPTPTNSVALESISTPRPTQFVGADIEKLANEMVAANDVARPILLERVSPVEFKVLRGEKEYSASIRAAEINPNFEPRATIIKKGTPAYDNFLRQEEVYKEIAQLSDTVELKGTATAEPEFKPNARQSAQDAVGTKTLDLESIKSYRSGNYNPEAVEKLAQRLLETGDNVRPIVVRRTSPTDFEVIRGHLEYLAAKRASEINPQFTGVRAFITDASKERALLAQLDLLDESIPTPTANPIVLGESLITNIADLKDEVRIDSFISTKEIREWMPAYITPLTKSGEDVFELTIIEIRDIIEDLELDALTAPAVMNVIGGGVRKGKITNKSIEAVSNILNDMAVTKESKNVLHNIFNTLWRKSTLEQRKIVVENITATRLGELGLEKVQTKLPPPPDLPALSYVKASTVTPEVVDAYQVVNNSSQSIENLRVAALREQGFSGREASSMKVHPLSEEIITTGRVSDTSLDQLLKNRELSVTTPVERNWSSKMLKDIWEVATPAQKANIIDTMKANDLEYLGLERISRSNVIDDHLPKEGLFDTPC